MIDNISIASDGMWALAAERPNHVGYSQAAAAEGPLTRDEVVALSREIGERREAWRDACDAHLWDLYLAHPNGIRN